MGEKWVVGGFIAEAAMRIPRGLRYVCEVPFAPRSL